MAAVTEPKTSSTTVLGMGNPLLDISVIAGAELLEKYGLVMNNAIMAEEKHMPLYKDIMGMEPIQVAGGATQNTIRTLQWMSQEEVSPFHVGLSVALLLGFGGCVFSVTPLCATERLRSAGLHALPHASLRLPAPSTPQGLTSFSGCVGDDEFGKTLKACAEGDGVKTHYLIDTEVPTGTCAVLVKDKERSLCANLSAANNYKKSHLDKTLWPVVEAAQFYYIGGFFLTVSSESICAVGKVGLQQGPRDVYFTLVSRDDMMWMPTKLQQHSSAPNPLSTPPRTTRSSL